MSLSYLKKNIALWSVLVIGLLTVAFMLWLFWMPPLAGLRGHNPTRTRLMSIRQKQAAQKGLKYRIDQRWVPISRISPYLKHAVIAAEDDVFYRHAGVDLNALWISLKNNLKHHGFVQGGSTITQQVVKNLYLHPRKSILRKLKEAVIALNLERVLEKKRILEIYLNIAEWGRGIYGAEAAAQKYFGKSAADLNLDEAVALAAVLPSPLRHSPVREDRFLKWRVRLVQRQLKSLGYDFTPVPEDVLPPPEDLGVEEAEGDGVSEPAPPEPGGQMDAGMALTPASEVLPPEAAAVSPTAGSLGN